MIINYHFVWPFSNLDLGLCHAKSVGQLGSFRPRKVPEVRRGDDEQDEQEKEQEKNSGGRG